MSEKDRISSLFEKLYNGHPWIDVNIQSVLFGIQANEAAKKIKDCNSIWEIVNHLISWRINVLQRLNGSIIKTPAHNYFEPVTDTSPASWQKTMERFATVQTEWLQFLQEFHAGQFEKLYKPNNMTFYEHIQGILQHDAYHLGQIVLLKKLTNR